MFQVTVVGTEQVVSRLKAMPDKVRAGILKAVQQQWFGLQAYVVQSKLSGQVLKRVTGNLASSIHVGGAMSATQLIDTPTQIVGRVGTRVRYGSVHEYGGAYLVKAHIRRVGDRTQQVRSYTAHFPERSFLRSSLRDRASAIKDALEAVVSAALKEV